VWCDGVGYYHEAGLKVKGKEEEGFGVRIENVCIVVETETEFRWGGRTMLGLESVSLTPISRKMMEYEVMTDEEVRWVNEFHARCREVVGPRLEGKVKEWLERETQPITNK
jgi:Xaa-Pro aminopeptidase